MLTELEISRKRTTRNMASRAKKRNKVSRYGQVLQDRARGRKNTASWLASMAEQQKKSADELYATRRQALEASRTKAAMSNHPPKGIFGAVKSFFQRRGR